MTRTQPIAWFALATSLVAAVACNDFSALETEYPCKVNPASCVDAGFDAGHRISGAVFGASDVVVALSGDAIASRNTNVGGAYEFSGLRSGHYTVTPTKAGYAFSPPSISVVVTNTDVYGVGFSALPTYSIWGTVTGPGPLAGIPLKLNLGDAGTALTDGDGGYVFSGLTGDYRTYTITIDASGRMVSPPSQTVTYTFSGQLFLGTDLQPFRGADFSISPLQTETPYPMYDLYGVWGASSTDVWAVGAMGTVMHWDGGGWLPIQTGNTPTTLYSVWGSASNDVWAVGSFNGDGGAVLHWDGIGPSLGIVATAPRPLRAVSGTSAGDVWAVGESGIRLHWGGGTWTQVASSETADMFAVWGSSANDVWAAGSGDGLDHWDGGAWRLCSLSPYQCASPSVDVESTGLWGTSADSVWRIGHFFDAGYVTRWNGSEWLIARSADLQGPDNRLYGISGHSASDVWAVGSKGTIWHLDGGASSGGASSDGGAVALDGGGLGISPQPWQDVFGAGGATLRAVWASPTSNDVWAVGEQGVIVHWSQ